MNYCVYYQAYVVKESMWMVVGLLRSFEHLAFDRTLQKETGLIEYYVPEQLEQYFVEIMVSFQQQGIVSGLTKLPNRLMDPNQSL